MMGWDMGFGWGGMFFGGLMMIVFWGGLIALIVLAVRSFSGASNTSRESLDRQRSPSAAAQTPLEIVQTRYARGEIGKEEYEAISHDLQATMA